MLLSSPCNVSDTPATSGDSVSDVRVLIDRLSNATRVCAGEVQARFPTSVPSLSSAARSRSPFLVVRRRVVADRSVPRRRRRRQLAGRAGRRRTRQRPPPSPPAAARLRRVLGQLLRSPAQRLVLPSDAGRRPLPPTVAAAQSLDVDRQRRTPLRRRQRALLAGENGRRSRVTERSVR